MTHHIAQADGNGHLDVNGHTSPVSYHLTAEKQTDQDTLNVRIELNAPRDWLMEKGFSSEAVLIRENGDRTTMHSQEKLDVSGPLSIALSAQDDASQSETELGRRFPEFATH